QQWREFAGLVRHVLHPRRIGSLFGRWGAWSLFLEGRERRKCSHWSIRPTARRRSNCGIDVVIGHERTQRSQVVKQADVVALLALLQDEFPGAAASGHTPAVSAGTAFERRLCIG